jgi:hypothetical protein
MAREKICWCDKGPDDVIGTVGEERGTIRRPMSKITQNSCCERHKILPLNTLEVVGLVNGLEALFRYYWRLVCILCFSSQRLRDGARIFRLR